MVERLLDPATVIQDGWRHVALRGSTDYRIDTVDDALAIVATGRGGASILIRATPSSECSSVEWEWRVDRVQPSADLTRRETEDVAAAVFVVFGDPGMIEMPDPTPTLRYVWTNDRAQIGTVIDSPFLPGVVRSIVVRAGEERAGEWLVERRSLEDDFSTAFGEAPIQGVHAVAVLTDNDQTGEPVRAYYRSISLAC